MLEVNIIKKERLFKEASGNLFTTVTTGKKECSAQSDQRCLWSAKSAIGKANRKDFNERSTEWIAESTT